MNVQRLGTKLPDTGALTSFLLATRFDNVPKLWTCWPMGAVEERSWVALGSGEERIREYLKALQVYGESKGYLDFRSPTISDAIRVGLEAVRRAQTQDVYSHGLDMLVVTPKGINDHYDELGDDFGRILRRIQRQYKSTKKRR